MKKKLIFIFIIFILLSKLGYFLDLTKENTSEANILVSLGGDNGNRIKKTLELYKNNYISSKKIVITGIDNFDSDMKIYELEWRTSYLVKKGLKIENIIFNAKAQNTLEEILFIRDYMKNNEYNNLIIVSDPPHSRRIDFFANTIYKYKENGINLSIVASNNNWWNKESYYLNPEAIIFSLNEIIKLTYYYINYKLGKYDEE
jgi:uncharacterized SAM-binding protein YcdF (DUF218 family)